MKDGLSRPYNGLFLDVNLRYIGSGSFQTTGSVLKKVTYLNVKFLCGS